MSDADPHILIPTQQPARYAADLADKEKHALGFLPRTMYGPAYAAGRLYINTENNDPCGFLLRGPFRKTTRIYQTCITEDLRWMEHGRDLAHKLVRDAASAGAHQISLWCAADLGANDFWKACGFDLVQPYVKRRRKNRPHHRWQIDLPAGQAHRAKLLADPKEQSRSKILNLLGTWSTNSTAIDDDTRRRYE